MGMNGVNATLRFSNINLTSSCTAVRVVRDLTSSSATENIQILTLVEVRIKNTIKYVYCYCFRME